MRINRPLPVAIGAIALGLVACTDSQTPQSAVQDTSDGTPSEEPNAASEISPDTGYPPHDPEVTRWAGFGPADFGDGEEAVRIAWGSPLTGGTSLPENEKDACYMLVQNLEPDKLGIAFMFADGAFRRYEVDVAPLIPAHVAPGGIVVGMPAETAFAAFDNVEEQPHKYLEGGRTLTVTPDSGENAPENARLVVETDENGVITSWRVGLEPEVSYVEHCG